VVIVGAGQLFMPILQLKLLTALPPWFFVILRSGLMTKLSQLFMVRSAQ
jgi:hypothetical protein